MRSRYARSVVVAVALLLVSPVEALAHGGVYRGPSERVPPDAREPGDAPPPWGREGAEPSPAVTTGFSDWSFWWARRKDAVFEAVVAGRRTAVDRDEVRRWVVPALRSLLRDDVNFDIASAAVLGLARIGDAGSSEHLTAYLSLKRAPGCNERAHNVLEETSALALGLMDDGAARTTRLLRAVQGDPERNRAFSRPFSAFGIALREHDGVVGGSPEALITGLMRKERKREARPAALTALGVLGNAECVEALQGIALYDSDQESEETPGVTIQDWDRAAAIAALGVARSGGRTAVETLLVVVDGNESRAVRREAVLAVGHAASRTDEATSRLVLERLIGLLAAEAPRVAPAHVVQAIGRLGESRGASGAAAQSFLSGLLTADARVGVRTNAAIGLGLAARRSGAEQAPGRGALRGLFTRTAEPHERAAYAVALGLLRDHEAVPVLRAVLTSTDADAELRGYCAIGLGLLGAGEVTAEVVTAVDGSGNLELRVLGCLSLGLLGGDDAREALMRRLRMGADHSRLNVLGAAAWGVGANPDMDSIAELATCALDANDKVADIERALAATAIGLACAREDAPSLEAVRDALPYRLLTPPALEFLTIF